MQMGTMRHTVIETATYAAKADRALSLAERDGIASELAEDPTKGARIKDGGGVRKVRVATGGKGKSGGARVIYYFTGGDGEIYLLTIFAKNEKENLTKGELKELRAFAKAFR